MIDERRSSKCVLVEAFLISCTRKLLDGYSLELSPIRMIQATAAQNANFSVMFLLTLWKGKYYWNSRSFQMTSSTFGSHSPWSCNAHYKFTEAFSPL